jgi:hypothetical protein
LANLLYYLENRRKKKEKKEKKEKKKKKKKIYTDVVLPHRVAHVSAVSQ